MNALISFLLGPVLDKVLAFVPDPNQRAALQLEFAKIQASEEWQKLQAEMTIAAAQSEVNKTEAASGNWFNSMWRPASAWICVAGMFFQFVFAPTVVWVAGLAGKTVVLPQADTAVLVTMLFSLLGLGTWRSYDKAKGTA